MSYTDRDGDSHVDEYAVAADGRVDAGEPARGAVRRTSPTPTTTAATSCSAPTATSTSASATAARPATPSAGRMRLDTWLGKLLRIDPRPDGDQPYTVPADNPFVGQAGALPEIWSLRAAQPVALLASTRATGDLWIGDVGQNQIEEIDVGPAAAGGGRGLNFGWSAFEGTSRYNDDQPADGTVGPVLRATTTATTWRVLGHRRLRVPGVGASPALAGRLPLRRLLRRAASGPSPARASGRRRPSSPSSPAAIASFGEGPDRELYVLILEGPLLALRPA